jgi:hypothetical protein
MKKKKFRNLIFWKSRTIIFKNPKKKNIKSGNFTGEYVGEMDNNNNKHGYGIEKWLS